MSITLFGTCRLNNIPGHNNLNNLINYTHTTKEVIQLIKWLKHKLYIPSPYNKLCFRTGICEDKNIEFCNTYKEKYKSTKLFIMEICSNKKYIHNKFLLHHLCVDKNHPLHNITTPQEVLDNHTIDLQSDEEIEKDILRIQKILYPKNLIVVSHFNAKLNGEYIDSRNKLIKSLHTICAKYNIHFIDPTNILCHFLQSDIIADDLRHYTLFGNEVFTKYINNYISTHFEI